MKIKGALVMLCVPVVMLSAGFVLKPHAKKPKNIIFLIGDGMGTAQIFAGLTANHGHLNLERIKCIGFSKTQSSNDYVTDSAAGATAFSIGKKTYNGAIGVDSLGNPQPTILEIAEKNGLATGLVATSTITHATPASFIAHVKSRKEEDDIAKDFLKTDIDVFIGGGRKHFDKSRADKVDLLPQFTAKGYNLASTIDDAEKVKEGKLAALVNEDALPRMGKGRGNFLSRAATTAINILDKNDKGFFLMVEGSQIDWGGHANNSNYIMEEMVDFDNTIGAVLDWADKDGETLVVITADHETGGYALKGGNMKAGTVEPKFVTFHHTGVMVPVFAWGPGAEEFMGIYENNTIFSKFMDAFGFSK